MSPTGRSLNLLRRSGYVADVCERYIAAIRRKLDLFGFADLLAIHRREPGVLAIQATTRDHVADRLARARARPELAVWLRAGNRFAVWGWYRQGGRWRVKQVDVRGEDLAGIVLAAPRRQQKGERQRELFDLY